MLSKMLSSIISDVCNKYNNIVSIEGCKSISKAILWQYYSIYTVTFTYAILYTNKGVVVETGQDLYSL